MNFELFLKLNTRRDEPLITELVTIGHVVRTRDRARTISAEKRLLIVIEDLRVTLLFYQNRKMWLFRTHLQRSGLIYSLHGRKLTLSSGTPLLSGSDTIFIMSERKVSINRTSILFFFPFFSVGYSSAVRRIYNHYILTDGNHSLQSSDNYNQRLNHVNYR